MTYLPTLAAGILLSWCFPRFHFHWLAWVALAPLFVRAMTLSPLAAAGHFYLCGHVFHTILLQWLVANIFWAGGWAIIGQQLLCVILSLFWAVSGYLWRYAHQRSPRYGGALCLACLWVAMELLQARLFTGFGWGALGYTQGGNLWTAQWAALGGVSFVSFLLVLVNALLAQGVGAAGGNDGADAKAALAPRVRLVCLGGALALVLVAHGIGYLLLAEADYESQPLQAGVVQPNFAQEMKWDSAYDFDMLQRTAQLTRVLDTYMPADLMVWPEALIVRHFERPLFMEALSSVALDTQAYIFTGAVREEYASAQSYNSSALVSPEGKIQGHYDKVHLAPFGEYIPFETYLPFISAIAFGGVSPGEGPRTFPVENRLLGPLICFEVLFAPMAERLRGLGADMLVVITNLAWFGGSNAIPQELEIARMRAIETRLPLVHSANTGISGVFDPYGRFSVVSKTVSPRGELMDWGPVVDPRHVMMRRFVDTFPVAAPGMRLIPLGPVILPWALAAAAPILALFALYEGYGRKQEKAPEKPKPTKPTKPRKPRKAKASTSS